MFGFLRPYLGIMRMFSRYGAYALLLFLGCMYAIDSFDLVSLFCNTIYDNPRTVVVVGGGLAGQAAAVEAYRAGAKVILLEKEKRLGGNSGKATSGMNGAWTRFQKQNGINDSLEAFMEDTTQSGHGLCKPALVEALVHNSEDAVDWVASFGLDLSNLVQMGGHSAKRTHRQPAREDGKPTPIGFNIVSAVKKHLESLAPERMTIMVETRAHRVLEKGLGVDRKITGVEVLRTSGEVQRIDCDAVVLATGGFGNDHTDTSLLKEFVPKLAGMPTTNGVFAQGDGVKMARQLGAGLVHMDQVQLHPSGFVDPKDPHNAVKFLCPEAMRGAGGIMVNGKGERFYNELGRRDDVSTAILKERSYMPGVADSPSVAYIITNEEASVLFGLPNLAFYKAKGLVRPTNISSLAAEIGADAQTLVQTLENYGRTDDPFGKKVIPVLFQSSQPLWVSTITPAIHYTMGGVEINKNAQLQQNGKPIQGFFGAGEVTGGVHGGNRLGGNSLLECVVFGKIAGRNAALGVK